MKHRTAIANQQRGLLAEYGIVLPKGLGYLRKRVASIAEVAEQFFDGRCQSVRLPTVSGTDYS
jgi:hypothetical protein